MCKNNTRHPVLLALARQLEKPVQIDDLHVLRKNMNEWMLANN
jgi:hypothetical protein